MTVTVLDSKDLITHLTTGETPVPAGIAEDNERQKAAADKENGRDSGKQIADARGGDKSAAEALQKSAEATTGKEADDVEGDDGLTPRQKREWTAAMLKSVGKKHREKLEAEEFAADQYNNRRLAEQRAEAEAKRRAELEQELAQLRKPTKSDELKEPKREDFQTDVEFADAIIDYKVEQKLRKNQIEEAARRAQEEHAAVVAAAEQRLKTAAELVPDFAETVDTDLNVPGHIAAYMQRSPLFAELGYHFAKHPEVLAELRKLTPAEALVEVGVIKSTLQPFASRTAAGTEGKVNGQKPSTSETESASAPSAAGGNGADPSKPRGTAPVITPLSAGSTSQVEKPPEQRNIREEIAAWQKNNQRNLGLRKRH